MLCYTIIYSILEDIAWCTGRTGKNRRQLLCGNHQHHAHDGTSAEKQSICIGCDAVCILGFRSRLEQIRRTSPIQKLHCTDFILRSTMAALHKIHKIQSQKPDPSAEILIKEKGLIERSGLGVRWYYRLSNLHGGFPQVCGVCEMVKRKNRGMR